MELLNEQESKRREKTDHILSEIDHIPDDTLEDKMRQEVTEKPGENNTVPLIPAYCNFEMARRMAQENLEHQPLPDSIMDRAFRKLQAQGVRNPELALDVYPTATGKLTNQFIFDKYEYLKEVIAYNNIRRRWCSYPQCRTNSLHQAKGIPSENMRRHTKTVRRVPH